MFLDNLGCLPRVRKGDLPGYPARRLSRSRTAPDL